MNSNLTFRLHQALMEGLYVVVKMRQIALVCPSSVTVYKLNTNVCILGNSIKMLDNTRIGRTLWLLKEVFWWMISFCLQEFVKLLLNCQHKSAVTRDWWQCKKWCLYSLISILLERDTTIVKCPTPVGNTGISNNLYHSISLWFWK